jgi:hypothetical protein
MHKLKCELALAICLSCFLCGCSEKENSAEETSVSGWETITEGTGFETVGVEESTSEDTSTESQDASSDDSSSEAPSSASTEENDSIPAAYREILETIRAAMKKQGEAVLEMDVDYLPAEYSQGYSVGYEMQDVDGNGVEELILETVSEQYEDSFIYAMFTLSNDEAVQVFNYGGARNRYYICSDGTVENQGSSGAAYSNWMYYKLVGTELVLQEAVFTRPDEQDETTMCWYYATTEPYEDNSTKITGEEASEIRDAYTEDEFSMTTLE